jgi:hypothetical protein
LQLVQSGSRFNTKFLDEHGADMPVGRKGPALVAVTVEGEHQQAVQVLPQRVDAGQVPQLGDHLGVTAQVQVGVHACFQCLQPHLRQPGGFTLRQHCGVDVC